MNVQGRKIATKFHSYFFFFPFSLWQVKIIEILSKNNLKPGGLTNSIFWPLWQLFSSVKLCWGQAYWPHLWCFHVHPLQEREQLLLLDSLRAVAFDGTQGLMAWRQILYLQSKRKKHSFHLWVDYWDPGELAVRKFQFNRWWGNLLNVSKAQERIIRKTENWA